MIEVLAVAEVPTIYSDAASEYAAVRGEGAGLLDLSAQGRVRVTGLEAIMFLNGLITNDVKTLPDNMVMKAAFPNAQGRLQAMSHILRQSDEFLLMTEAVTAEKVAQLVGRFVFAGDFRVANETHATAQFIVAGAQAVQIMSAVLGVEAACLTHGHSSIIYWQDAPVTVLRLSRLSVDGFDCIIESAHAAALWRALIMAGAQPIGAETAEVLRIEAGLPRFGIDMDETSVVLETGQDDAVSYTKGCYIGQEIIARIHWRGHVAKRLAGLQCAGRAAIAPDAEIQTPEGKNVGRVTSATFSPQLGCTIALGYVRYAQLAPGTELHIVTGNETSPARIVELPFIK